MLFDVDQAAPYPWPKDGHCLEDDWQEWAAASIARLVVGARISKSSNATPQPGDLQGMSGTVTNGTAGITVLIDTEIR